MSTSSESQATQHDGATDLVRYYKKIKVTTALLPPPFTLLEAGEGNTNGDLLTCGPFAKDKLPQVGQSYDITADPAFKHKGPWKCTASGEKSKFKPE